MAQGSAEYQVDASEQGVIYDEAIARGAETLGWQEKKMVRGKADCLAINSRLQNKTDDGNHPQILALDTRFLLLPLQIHRPKNTPQKMMMATILRFQPLALVSPAAIPDSSPQTFYPKQEGQGGRRRRPRLPLYPDSDAPGLGLAT